MKYIDAERLRVEIERRITDNTFGAKLELIDILAWLDSLQQEQQESGSSEKPNNLVEWSEEDKRKFNRIYEILGYAADDKGFLTSKRIIGDKEAIELQDFLRSLRSQPKQEWSEEDEKDIQEAPDCLRDYANNYVQGGNSKLYLQSLADRIESLRPQPHWKPSEEQMKYLDIAIAEANGHKSYNLAYGLEKIKDDLKKL